MPTTQNTQAPKRIAFIGKFKRLWDEEYIARSFEMLGHTVIRIEQGYLFDSICHYAEGADILLFAKLDVGEPKRVLAWAKEKGIKTVSWNFDLYWNYAREYRLAGQWSFKADYVFTTDGGEHEWGKYNINHQCVRQGIYKDECFLEEGIPKGIVFVGSINNLYPPRQEMMKFLQSHYDIKWLGKLNSNEIRGIELNKLYANSKIIVGDSVYSPQYWSNRVVETLGRGGFLIHQEVEGIKEEYPYLVTYKRGDFNDLKTKIDYYLTHEEERKEIVRKNFEWVRDNYTMDKKCQELLSKI